MVLHIHKGQDHDHIHAGIGEDPDGFKGDHIIPLGFKNMSLEVIVQLQMIDDDIQGPDDAKIKEGKEPVGVIPDEGYNLSHELRV